MSGILAGVMGAVNWGVPTYFPGMFTQEGTFFEVTYLCHAMTQALPGIRQ
jgi:hypothetical protein